MGTVRATLMNKESPGTSGAFGGLKLLTASVSKMSGGSMRCSGCETFLSSRGMELW